MRRLTWVCTGRASPTAELGIFAVGVWLYVRSTRSVDAIGAVALWTLVALLLLVYIGNVLGDPPPSVGALAWMAQAQWLIVLWGYWVDRHREAVGRQE